MKRESHRVDGTPHKRLFWSIISDYNINTAICELVDNALDIWTRGQRQEHLSVQIELDVDSRTIQILDNAGGVPETELQVLVSPGASLNSPDANLIGLFGVGSKRAVVALARTVKIRTRRGEGNTYQIDIDEAWLEDEDWEMPIYEVNEVSAGSTVIDLLGLRYTLDLEAVENLRRHLGETYGRFLSNERCQIAVNGTPVQARTFDAWAFPPRYEPRYLMFEAADEDGAKVGVEVYAGLVLDREPAAENYGVYFYCNERLIVKEVRDAAVGYISGAAGIPHPDASLARVIVLLYGPAKLMPWNSNKTAIDFNKPLFREVREVVVPVLRDFSSLSRRLKGKWEEKVFRYKTGGIEHSQLEDVKNVKKSVLPPLPRVRKKPIEKLKNDNSQILRDKPWILGLLESLAAQELISRQGFATRNRIALILLDSNFEIALKEYVVHTEGLDRGGRSLEELFKQRDAVLSVVQQKISFPRATLQRIRHYYSMRNKLIHERATVDVTKSDIANFREAVAESLELLFGIRV